MVETQFKNTDIGLIPEDWEVKELNDLLDLLTDFEANGSFINVAQNVKIYNTPNYAWFVRATDLENKSSLSKVKYVDEKSYKFLSKTSLYGNELLITKRGEIGKLYFYENKNVLATLAPNLYLLKLNFKIIGKYLFYHFKEESGNKKLININSSSTLGAIYKDDVKKIKIPLPPLPEQQAIAEVLSDTDAWIESLEKLIAKKRLIKQGAMQQLLTPKEDWEVKKLGEIANITRGASPRPINNPIWFDDKSNVGWVRISDVSKAKKYLSKTEQNLSHLGIKNSRFVEVNSLIMSICATIGKPIITIKKVCIHDGFVVFTDLKIDQNYLYNYLCFIENEWSKKGQTGSQMNLNTTLINDKEIYYPSLLIEQTRIATILSDMDAEIEHLEKKLNKAKQLKQGIMQQLLTGKIRLIAGD